MFVAGGNVRRNRVLASLSTEDLALIQQHLQPTGLKLRQCVEVVNREIDAVYFPYSGIISMVVHSNNRQHQSEIGIIGHEGMTGLPVVLGTERAYCSAFVQVGGDGVCLPAQALRKLMLANRSLRLSLLRYVQAFVMQTIHTALANTKGKVEKRLDRWLLLAADRVAGDDVRLKHDCL